MHKHTNRLAKESSPYLLQHAHNPVDWYAWGEEAFAEARRRGVPIFLSVGYSTCYWCHVMERESFENEATARVMNERFVCVKVDREERPDVDELSMAATVTFTGRGGWPTSVFLEPVGLRPFFAGTYFPPAERYGIPSFTRVLEGMSEAWDEQRAEVLEQAEILAEAVAKQLGGGGAGEAPVAVGPAQVQKAVATLLQIFDRTEG
ncbi:thioredoxin domain-containing protein, partial [Nodularia spumigena]|uniref:thioredoxin domain-containing protein n=1 Tax=Nodularia spumigena TaxID=70799 RepID=UPI002B2150C8